MNIRTFTLTSVALVATAAALAEAPKPIEPKPAREQTLLEEAAAGMREILRAVVPEIALPKLEVKLPSLDAAAR